MLTKSTGVGYAFAVSGCVGAALLLAMLISGFVGTAIPLIFDKLHIDPAVASGPLITTINDLVADYLLWACVHLPDKHLGMT